MILLSRGDPNSRCLDIRSKLDNLPRLIIRSLQLQQNCQYRQEQGAEAPRPDPAGASLCVITSIPAFGRHRSDRSTNEPDWAVQRQIEAGQVSIEYPISSEIIRIICSSSVLRRVRLRTLTPR